MKSKNRYINEKIRILTDFKIEVTKSMIDKMEELYPNDIYIENYVRTLIRNQVNSLD